MWPSVRWAWSALPDELLDRADAMQVTPGALLSGGELTGVADYPQFLGPDRNGAVRGIKLETDWSAHPPKELWRRKIGAGWSAFSVVGQRAITQEQRGPDEMVVCYALAGGEILWKHADPVRFSEELGYDGPRATPTIAGDSVFTLGATGILNCLDLETGKLRWTRDIVDENGSTIAHWGMSGSPLIVDDVVVVCAGGKARKSLVAYDRKTGEPRYSGGNAMCTYSSPALATLGGTRQILCVMEDWLVSHDASDARVLWRYPWPGKHDNSPTASQPVAVGGDRVLLSKGYGAGSVLLRIEQAGGKWKDPEEIWKKPTQLNTKFSNVVLHEGFIYGLNNKLLQCVELSTGEQQWKRRGNFGLGQIMLVGDVILIVTENSGEVVLVRATPEAAEAEEFARLKILTGKTWNNPCLAGRYLLVRNAEEAACYELPVVSSQ